MRPSGRAAKDMAKRLGNGTNQPRGLFLFAHDATNSKMTTAVAETRENRSTKRLRLLLVGGAAFAASASRFGGKPAPCPLPIRLGGNAEGAWLCCIAEYIGAHLLARYLPLGRGLNRPAVAGGDLVPALDSLPGHPRQSCEGGLTASGGDDAVYGKRLSGHLSKEPSTARAALQYRPTRNRPLTLPATCGLMGASSQSASVTDGRCR